jgi:hypothetical protein
MYISETLAVKSLVLQTRDLIHQFGVWLGSDLKNGLLLLLQFYQNYNFELINLFF